MKYVDEFRNPEKAQALQQEIAKLSQKIDKHIKIMEVCGGHTHSIFKYGIEEILPDNIELIHGPGCPVCVMPKGRIDDAIALSQNPHIIFTTFGDAMRVPGSTTSLLQAKAQGADIRMVYSPLDSLKIAQENPNKEIVFFGLGFETTAPSTAFTILQAAAENITNFSMFSNHVLVIPALQALLDNPDLQLDGFVGPGHVSMVIGTEPYEFISQKYHKPIVISGFELLDIFQSIWMLLKQIVENRCQVENQYNRLVEPAGNKNALKAMNQVFAVRETFEWRGLGEIPNSGLKIQNEYAQFDAEVKFPIPNLKVADHKACQCGEILKGVLKPWQCKVFGTACTPETPIGTCMVSSEGACAAYYKYGRLSTIARKTKVSLIQDPLPTCSVPLG
ncbi:hydrogenase formation protein HypD [Anabaena cylindrica FACHB-243]|uniref:Hydrogenase expression/formation protein HypD n=1 Tax=Anabaena cylindrica (strain ATCC 27899 / PCC 7122) TaxID=272123 RepID=K9ZFE4_ANACC|nr:MULTISPECIES: hydrogenase formation protein HypD [Anabaena]AFZ57292.1 hydrogenase expression/formation protein HypD [Anabaena cylindrica PCC 7122]AZL96688.1 hydrogenase expression/formation protein HypD [Anabaena sp. CCAP 1446/1C]MBD2420961.1 hydrogenase formation protein HypD [Anabaena cylindrica FACHB-243]MBY5283438.1 hydrogenase formation protein HypD [Anabaena sp. CCAP 1446/1C]MBY5310884.1 hydrogenase formation protein HypD [Anabaena sp. CCAP 1446/1C]